jgi:hypothetical protein
VKIRAKLSAVALGAGGGAFQSFAKLSLFIEVYVGNICAKSGKHSAGLPTQAAWLY